MQPIPARYANHITNKYLAGDSNKTQILNRIRLHISKEHWKMVLWLEIFENYKGLAGDDYTLKKVQYEYEQDSLIWKSFYGKEKSDIDLDQAFKDWMAQNKITQVMLDQTENPSSKTDIADTPMKESETTITPGKTAEEKIAMLKKIATVVHFQVRLVLNARVLIVDRERYPDFYFDLSKLQFLFANPAGVLKANVSLLLTTMSMSIFIPVPKKPTKNKIFDNEVVISNRKNAAYQMLSKPLRGFINYDKNMEPFTIFEMGKFYFNLDADTHKNWKPNPNPNKPRAFLDEYLPVINLTAQTPVVHICFGSSIIEKLHSLAVGFLDKDRIVDFKQKGRGLKISMADTALDMGALKDIYNKNK